MAWKQDLAKLKQQLRTEEPPAASKPLPKVPPKPGAPAPLVEEDAVFLSAMGLKPTPAAKAKPETAAPAEAPLPGEEAVPETFQAAIKDLKGLKPMQKGLLEQPASPAKVPSEVPKVEVPPSVPMSGTLLPPSPPSQMEPAPAPLLPEPRPLRFQLAAGMAIEVDGSLDLRGHSLPDALDRLKDRLGDGLVLGWRSLQVNLGTDPALHEGLLALLASGQLPMVARFAQAPVPMGGTQAWLLYFGPPAAHPQTPRREP